MLYNHFFIVCLALFIFIISISTILPSWEQNQQLQTKVDRLQAEVQQLRIQKKDQEQELAELEHAFYVEFLLRKRFYYGRKNEKIVHHHR